MKLKERTGPQNNVKLAPRDRDILTKKGCVKTCKTEVFPNKYTGIISDPVVNANLMKPFLHKTTSSVGEDKNNSAIPPGYKTKDLPLPTCFKRFFLETSIRPKIPMTCFNKGN